MKSIIITAIAFVFLFVPITAFAESQADGILELRIFGDKFEFSNSNFQEKSNDIRFESGDGNTIHRYVSDATIGDLFDSMNIGFDDECYVFPDGRQFCSNEDYSLSFYVNKEKVPSLENYVFQNNDRILISYSSDSFDEIQTQLSRLDTIQIQKSNSDIIVKEKPKIPESKEGYAKLIIRSNTNWNAVILDGNQATNSFDGHNNAEYDIQCGKINIISLSLQKQTDYGFIDIQLVQKGKILNQARTTAQYGIASVASECLPEFGGGCLIATATYGSELAPQVQQLREIRDNSLLTTTSGVQFMSTFNDFYYSFSPIIADYERENPMFREMVKVAITPMITSLSLMEYAESESSVLGIGVSLIIINGLMYVGIPAIVIVGIRKF